MAVNSGTAALHTALLAYGITEGDEVIVPAFTFEATANMVLACGAKPVFADVTPDYTIDPDDVRRKVTKKTKAVIPVHVYGYPADLDAIREIAGAHSLRVIEDAAESLGAEYKGRQTGNTRDAGCFSLYSTKVITSGEGGAITTDDDELADSLRLVRNHGSKEPYETRTLGFNYRLPEVSAAIASIQMDKLGGLLEARKRNADALTESILPLKDVRLTQSSPERKHMWYLYTLNLARNRDRVHDKLRAKGIGASVYWRTPVNRMPLYARLGYGELNLPRTYAATQHVLSLPDHPGVTPEDIEVIAKEFKSATVG